MEYTVVNLKYKILELYPEIIHYGLDIFIHFDQHNNSYEVKIIQPSPETTVLLDKKDADACIEGNKSEQLSDRLATLIAKLPAQIDLLRK